MGKRKHSGRPPRRRDTASARRAEPDAIWLYGQHAVAAALANPRRRCLRLLIAEGAAAPPSPLPDRPPPEAVPRPMLAQHLPPGAVHQGVALQAAPLPPVTLEDAVRPRPGEANLVVVLDQVTDPRNVGAVLRSAAAFEARAVIAAERHAPAESGALAKAASGALERLPLLQVPNLARALERLAELGYWRFGLDAAAAESIDTVDLGGNAALVLGAEGAGLRRLTAEHCDHLVRLPIASAVESLNVSAAAAIALYLARKAARRAPPPPR